MKKLIQMIVIVLALNSCGNKIDNSPYSQINWENRLSEKQNFEDYHQGKTYLPVYSHIYHNTEHRIFDHAINVSIRNISPYDSVFIINADYYNTAGDNIRQYAKKPIYLKPLETIEIIIRSSDKEGGSGANFIFDWAMKNDKNPPLFEAVMISTEGGQGLSYTTRGITVYD